MQKYTDLIENARKASINSYSPYSNFKVGAAVLTRSGNIYLGTNVENASYSLTICAERVAISNAVSHGERDILAVAIYTDTMEISPCGACRQFISEFGNSIDIVFRVNNSLIVKSSGELIPYSFAKEHMV